MRDEEPGPFNRKRPRKPDYKAGNEDSDARSHPNMKKSKRYVIMLLIKKHYPEIRGRSGRKLREALR